MAAPLDTQFFFRCTAFTGIDNCRVRCQETQPVQTHMICLAPGMLLNKVVTGTEIPRRWKRRGTIPYKAANLKHNEAQSARVEPTHKGVNRRSSEIQGTALGKCLRARSCIYRSMPAGVAQSRRAFVGGTVITWAR